MPVLPRPVATVLCAAMLAPLLPAQTQPPAPAVQLDKFVVTPSHFALADTGAAATLTQRDLETLPQVGEDLFRSIARLPGVTADDFTAKFWVRGAPQRQLLVRLDGADLLEPFHLKDVDGALSIIDLHAIRRLDLMTGGFTTDYGNRAAGVLTMESLSPTGSRPAAALGLSLTSMRAGGTGTFAGGAGRWFGSIRRGYPDIALKVEGRDDEVYPRYWDAYAKLEFDLSGTQTVSLHVLHASDTLRVRDDNGPELRSGYDSDTVWTRWRAQFTDRLNAETVLSGAWLTWHRAGAGLYSTRYHLDLRERRSLETYTLRQDWGYTAGPDLLLRGGWQLDQGAADYSYHLFREDPVVVNGVLVASPRTIALTPQPDDSGLGLFVAPRWAANSALTIEPGVRFDRHTATGDRDVSPRLNLAYAFDARTTLRAAWGRYGQSQGLQELPVQFGDATFQRSEMAEHRVLGVEHRFGAGLHARVELYQRETAHPRAHWLSRYDNYNVFPEAQTDRLLLSPGRASAEGVEIMLQQRGAGRFNWTASYALSRAVEEIGAVTVSGMRDQRHAFYADLTYTPNPRWAFSAAWQYHTGWPVTDVNFTLVTLNNGSRTVVRSFGPTLGSRLPAYHRLDLRASRTIPLRHGVVKVFVDVFNAYDQANVLAYNYGTSTAGGVLTVKRSSRNLLPILPTAGLSWEI